MSIDDIADDRQGMQRAVVRLREADALPAAIAAANGAVRLEGFHALLPSMDDIFIKTVEASNLKTPVEQ